MSLRVSRVKGALQLPPTARQCNHRACIMLVQPADACAVRTEAWHTCYTVYQCSHHNEPPGCATHVKTHCCHHTAFINTVGHEQSGGAHQQSSTVQRTALNLWWASAECSFTQPCLEGHASCQPAGQEGGESCRASPTPRAYWASKEAQSC
jgi:hypothetical protein